MAEHIPHDLPEYEPNDPPQWRVRVFRDKNGLWCWAHRCQPGHTAEFWGHPAWALTFSMAYSHAKGCL